MPTVTEADLSEIQKKDQVKSGPNAVSRIAAEIQKGQTNAFVLIAFVAFATQYAGIDLAHLAFAYLLFRGLPVLTVNYKSR